MVFLKNRSRAGRRKKVSNSTYEEAVVDSFLRGRSQMLTGIDSTLAAFYLSLRGCGPASRNDSQSCINPIRRLEALH